MTKRAGGIAPKEGQVSVGSRRVKTARSVVSRLLTPGGREKLLEGR